jgi:hypothetical protein
LERERTLDRRREPVRLVFLARPRDSGESVIAVELADDLDDTIDGLEVRTLRSGVHRAERHEQRFVETADLKREEFGWRLRHTLREDFANHIAHPLERKTLAGGDLGHRSAAIEETHDPLFTSDFSRRVALRIPDDPPRRAELRGEFSRLGFGISLMDMRTNIEHRWSFGKKMSFPIAGV